MAAWRTRSWGVTDPNVLAAMESVPRHRFVPEALGDDAYANHPLPIGYGQTISQPQIVAVMSEALRVGPGARVLEIGAGSGYQAAVLAAMGCAVYTVEIVPALAARARAVLTELGYDVTVRAGDGYEGWPENSPYDGIIVTAAPPAVPPPLLDQLAPGAALVIPVGPAHTTQTLWRITVAADGTTSQDNLGGVVFVPFTRNEPPPD
jgi:protein-L-isoaspartate(D-aspartate) O-methyltransferase